MPKNKKPAKKKVNNKKKPVKKPKAKKMPKKIPIDLTPQVIYRTVNNTDPKPNTAENELIKKQAEEAKKQAEDIKKENDLMLKRMADEQMNQQRQQAVKDSVRFKKHAMEMKQLKEEHEQKLNDHKYYQHKELANFGRGLEEHQNNVTLALENQMERQHQLGNQLDNIVTLRKDDIRSAFDGALNEYNKKFNKPIKTYDDVSIEENDYPPFDDLSVDENYNYGKQKEIKNSPSFLTPQKIKTNILFSPQYSGGVKLNNDEHTTQLHNPNDDNSTTSGFYPNEEIQSYLSGSVKADEIRSVTDDGLGRNTIAREANNDVVSVKAESVKAVNPTFAEDVDDEEEEEDEPVVKKEKKIKYKLNQLFTDSQLKLYKDNPKKLYADMCKKMDQTPKSNNRWYGREYRAESNKLAQQYIKILAQEDEVGEDIYS